MDIFKVLASFFIILLLITTAYFAFEINKLSTELKRKQIEIGDLQIENKRLEEVNEGLINARRVVKSKVTQSTPSKAQDKIISNTNVSSAWNSGSKTMAVSQEVSASNEDKKETVKTEKEVIDSILIRWDDALSSARTTSRINLVPQIEKMQSIKNEVINAKSSYCLTPSKERLVKSMNDFIEGMQFFKSNPADLGEDLFIIKEKQAKKDMEFYKYTSQQCVDMI